MAPKTFWIHNFTEPSTKLKKEPKNIWIRNFTESAEPPTKLKMAPKTYWIHKFIESAEPSTKLKKAPKTIWIHNFIESAEPPTKLKMEPKNIWSHNCIEVAVPPNLVQAPKLSWIQKHIATTESNDYLIGPITALNLLKTLPFWIHYQWMSSDHKQELRMAPNFTWIPYFTRISIHIDLAKLTIKLKNITFWYPVFIKLTNNLNATSSTPTPTQFLTQVLISFMATFYITIGGLSNGESTDCGNNTITIQMQRDDLPKQIAQPRQPGQSGQPGQQPQHPLKATTQSSTNLYILDTDHERTS
jgi:hypothetical protein